MLDWLRLIRASGLFTIAANLATALVVAYYASGSLDLHPFLVLVFTERGSLPVVAAASALLYIAGMLWNDINDVERDRSLHPRRPLPSGRIGLITAYVAAVLASIGALLVAGQHHSGHGLNAAGVVLALILLYDFVTKEIPVIGAVTLALVRASHALFVLLALGGDYLQVALIPGPQSTITEVVLSYPLLLGLYIFGVAWMAELETRPGRRLELVSAVACMVLAVVLAGVRLGTSHWIADLLRSGGPSPALVVIALAWGVVLLGLVAWTVGRPAVAALRSGRRGDIGPAVGAALAGIILVDALIATSVHPLAGLLIALLYPVFCAVARVMRMD